MLSLAAVIAVVPLASGQASDPQLLEEVATALSRQAELFGGVRVEYDVERVVDGTTKKSSALLVSKAGRTLTRWCLEDVGPEGLPMPQRRYVLRGEGQKLAVYAEDERDHKALEHVLLCDDISALDGQRLNRVAVLLGTHLPPDPLRAALGGPFGTLLSLLDKPREDGRVTQWSAERDADGNVVVRFEPASDQPDHAQYRYVVSPEYGMLVLACEVRTPDGQLFARITNDGFKQRDSVWVPTRVQIEEFDISHQPASQPDRLDASPLMPSKTKTLVTTSFGSSLKGEVPSLTDFGIGDIAYVDRVPSGNEEDIYTYSNGHIVPFMLDHYFSRVPVEQLPALDPVLERESQPAADQAPVRRSLPTFARHKPETPHIGPFPLLSLLALPAGVIGPAAAYLALRRPPTRQ